MSATAASVVVEAIVFPNRNVNSNANEREIDQLEPSSRIQPAATPLTPPLQPPQSQQPQPQPSTTISTLVIRSPPPPLLPPSTDSTTQLTPLTNA